ncbi:hypothetical protein A9P82_03960 [Arachidicoccus ginsenosidimutans]|uniref:hypothetical protein n=1 Tax=Arachidicoccus sp. BS20 TaxID=1850526 RepID=UPI0007F08A14|nr:hypothetical protein [Arachidicoccus sp. BS20]ANI88527.1 hypothetical protein A9P82_03960 [Arachidicoccus sp. BS20]
MARQYKLQTFTGKVGNEIYYIRNGKLCKRSCAKNYRMSKESRKASTEFGRASSLSAKLRKALLPYFLPAFDRMLHSRLTARLRAVSLSGPTNMNGKRNVTDGNIALLNGLELNNHVRFDQLLYVTCVTYIADDTVTIAIPPIDPNAHISMPKHAARAILSIAGVSVSLEGHDDDAFCIDEIIIEKDKVFAGTEVSFYLPDKGKRLVAIMLCIYFEQPFRNTFLRIEDKRYQAGIFTGATIL